MTAVKAGALVLSASAILCGLSAEASAVSRKSTTTDGLEVYEFSWTDAAGFKRTASLKKQGEGNPGNGGYAVRMTYQVQNGDGSRRTVVAKAPKNDGFGYFVSHERYRTFNDGKEDSPIAQKIFNTDDSPLGRGFPVTARIGANDASLKSIRFSLSYPRYGTKEPGGIDQTSGQDKPKLGTARSLFQLYQLPVTIEWSFEDGRDYPRITTTVSLAGLPGPDRASFDLRGPYGKLDFDDGDNPIAKVTWGDRYLFATEGAPVTRKSTWTWNERNPGARFIGITAGGYEMGLLEPKLYSKSNINDGFAYGRGKTSEKHSSTKAGCKGQELPCDYEWPYQATNYELPYDNLKGTTTSEKIAWGSTPFYGMSIDSTWDGKKATPFDGFPASGRLTYDVCVVLGETVGGGLTRFVAEGGGDYSCASRG